MSQNDSEMKDALSFSLKDKRHKQLHLDFRSKKPIGGQPSLKKLTELALTKHKSLYLEPIKQEFRLVRAVSLNNTNEVKRLLDQGVSPDSTDNERRSVLHVAVSKGYSEIVKLLLHYGADPNKRDVIQNTPLHLAACVHNLPIISMLINAKADVSCLDLHGRNPLQLASSKLQILRKSWRDGSIEMVKLREELQQVIDLLLSFLIRGVEERMERLNRNRVNVDELQMVKVTVNSGPSEHLDNQMTKLLEDIENFQIK